MVMCSFEEVRLSPAPRGFPGVWGAEMMVRDTEGAVSLPSFIPGSPLGVTEHLRRVGLSHFNPGKVLGLPPFYRLRNGGFQW